jgi:hypothetical protein
MRVFAYCAASFREATRRAAGVEPLTCPPASAEHFERSWLEERDFLYFDLHGMPGEPFWYGDGGTVALRADQVGQCSLKGAVVFAANCYLADKDSPMMDALLQAGARYVVGGQGQNWAGGRTVYGASLLGMRLRQLLERGMDPLKAITLAKRWVRLGLVANRVLGRKDQVQAAEDTLAFRVYYRRDMDDGTEGGYLV